MNKQSATSFAIAAGVLLVFLMPSLVGSYRENFTAFVMSLVPLGVVLAIAAYRMRGSNAEEMQALASDRLYKLFSYAVILPVCLGFLLIKLVPDLSTPTTEALTSTLLVLVTVGFWIVRGVVRKKQQRLAKMPRAEADETPRD